MGEGSFMVAYSFFVQVVLYRMLAIIIYYEMINVWDTVSAFIHPLWCFCPRTFCSNNWLNMLSWISFISDLYTKPVGRFQAYQLLIQNTAWALRTPSQYKDHLSHVWVPMLPIRRSRDRLIFNMGNPTLVRRRLFIETVPSHHLQHPRAGWLTHLDPTPLWHVTLLAVGRLILFWFITVYMCFAHMCFVHCNVLCNVFKC